MWKSGKSAEIATVFCPQSKCGFSIAYQQEKVGKILLTIFPKKFSTFPSRLGRKNRVKKVYYKLELMFAVMSRRAFSREELPFFSSSSILVMEDKMVVWSLPPNSLPISGEDRLVSVRTR